MKVLVTGSNGFLAGHIVRTLLKNKYEVRAMLRAGSHAPALKGLNVEYFFGNITRLEDVDAAVEGCDYIIHAAADTSQHYRKVSNYHPVNIQATQHIINAANRFRCLRLVFVSTANVFGSGSAERPGDESFGQSSLFQRSGYAASKRIAQEMVLENCRKTGLNAVVVNPSFMIGNLDYKPSSGKIFNMVLGKRIVFYPPGGKNFVSVDSVASATVNALSMGQSGQAYLLTGTDYSYFDFFKLTCKLSGQKSLLIPIPAVALRVFGFAGGLLQSLGVKTSLSPTNAEILCRKFYYSNSKAVGNLMMKECRIEDAIGSGIEWFAQKSQA